MEREVELALTKLGIPIAKSQDNKKTTLEMLEPKLAILLKRKVFSKRPVAESEKNKNDGM